MNEILKDWEVPDPSTKHASLSTTTNSSMRVTTAVTIEVQNTRGDFSHNLGGELKQLQYIMKSWRNR